MNEPHENLDHDPFADDDARARARRRTTRLRRDASRAARAVLRGRCAVAPASPARGRLSRPCPRAARGPLREWR
jgi:hypothetical protein